MDQEDLALFRRSVEAATSSCSGAALDTALAELGWHDALADDPRAAISVLFEAQGRSNARSSALDAVLTHALGLDAAPVVLPPLGTGAPVGARRVALAGLDAASTAVAPSVVGDAVVAPLVQVARLARRAVSGLDADLGLVEVEVRGTDLAGARVDWDEALRLGRLALGHELVGASRRMLELAREHALARVQFGQPIARFQAVRHRLAETLVAIETAEALLDAAWLDGTALMGAMAKATAGRGARVTAKHCQQVLAGIGFTTEHDLHRHLRRVLVLDELLGSARTLTRELGEHLLRTRTLPPLLPL